MGTRMSLIVAPLSHSLTQVHFDVDEFILDGHLECLQAPTLGRYLRCWTIYFNFNYCVYESHHRLLAIIVNFTLIYSHPIVLTPRSLQHIIFILLLTHFCADLSDLNESIKDYFYLI
jgi:hypothetical protein